jgi:glutathionyl-hydroquinone reductase
VSLPSSFQLRKRPNLIPCYPYATHEFHKLIFYTSRFCTIIRFDPVYVQHFKCNIRDIRSGYPAIHKWMRNLYWNNSAFKDTTNFLHIKNHYTKSHTQINPFSIAPVGPLPDILPLDEEVPVVKAYKA